MTVIWLYLRHRAESLTIQSAHVMFSQEYICIFIFFLAMFCGLLDCILCIKTLCAIREHMFTQL